MDRDDEGFFSIVANDIAHGQPYRFRLDGDRSRPDPAAHAFESSVHEWSTAVDHSKFEWQADWKGVPKSDLIIYELHIGTFTNEGTFDSAIQRLPELIDLGITAVELLPLAQCPGKWNWGYDGVGLYAVQNTYGSPDDFKRFVDACHQQGLGVILDVVFNHLGPEGNYLSEFGPFFTKRHKTPWGDALNFDGKDSHFVRKFICDCATHWIENYRLDGLRLDAVHFMFDDSDTPMSMSVCEAVDQSAQRLARTVHLIGETNVRNASLTKGTSQYASGFDAVWSDGIMHSVLGIGQPGLDLCHRDHSGKSDAAIALQQGFVYENFPYERHDRGERADLSSFVVGMQNHDTVGNHPLGHRIHELASREFQMAAAALYLLYPAIPMVFMGEEFACQNPFLFFVDFHDSWVRDGVEKGRASEFPELAKLNGLSPLDPDSFFKSKLGQASDGDAAMRQWYRDLIRFRKNFRSEGFLDQGRMRVDADVETGLYTLVYHNASGQELSVLVRLANPDSETKRSPLDVQASQIILESPNRQELSDQGRYSIGVNEALVFRA
jgi:malto-oligosyltrehalose trehalohydrolase